MHDFGAALRDEGRAVLLFQFRDVPGRIAQGYTTYVVWFAPTGRTPVVATTLEFDEDDRTGNATATNATKTFDVLITAERNAQATVPSQYNVARFRVDAR